MQHLDSITTSKDMKCVLVYKCEEPTASVIMGDGSIAASIIRVDSITLVMEGQILTTLCDLISQNTVTILISAMKISTPTSRDL
jgi:hypothetical protein